MSNLVRKVNTHLSKGRDPHEPVSICKTGNTPTPLGPYCDRAGISAESFLKHDISSCGNIITCGLIYELERYRRKNGYPSSIIGHLLKSECTEKALHMSWSRIYERVTKMKKTHKPTESYLSSVHAIPRSDIPFAFSVVTKETGVYIKASFPREKQASLLGTALGTCIDRLHEHEGVIDQQRAIIEAQSTNIDVIERCKAEDKAEMEKSYTKLKNATTVEIGKLKGTVATLKPRNIRKREDRKTSKIDILEHKIREKDE